MVGWGSVEGSAPEFAAAVRATFAARKHATMATIRRDGSPRISGTEVDFGEDGELYLGMMTGTRRAADLRRDPRLALHSPTVDPPPDDPTTWAGEGKLDALAVEVAPDRFRLDVLRVVLTRVAAGGDALEILTWRPGSDVELVRRD